MMMKSSKDADRLSAISYFIVELREKENSVQFEDAHQRFLPKPEDQVAADKLELIEMASHLLRATAVCYNEILDSHRDQTECFRPDAKVILQRQHDHDFKWDTESRRFIFVHPRDLEGA